MIDDRPPAVRGGGAFSALASDGLTHVELTWIEKKLEHWIRFGRVAQDRILTRRTRVVGFRPHDPTSTSCSARHRLSHL